MDELPFPPVPERVDEKIAVPEELQSPLNTRLVLMYNRLAVQINACLDTVRERYSKESRLVVSDIGAIDDTMDSIREKVQAMRDVLLRYGTDGLFQLPQAHREALSFLEIDWPLEVPAPPAPAIPEPPIVAVPEPPAVAVPDPWAVAAARRDAAIAAAQKAALAAPRVPVAPPRAAPAPSAAVTPPAAAVPPRAVTAAPAAAVTRRTATTPPVPAVAPKTLTTTPAAAARAAAIRRRRRRRSTRLCPGCFFGLVAVAVVSAILLIWSLLARMI